MAVQLPMKAAPKPLLSIHSQFQLAGFGLGGIYKREFLPAFAVAVRDQNVGIGVCAYWTRDSNLEPGLFAHFPAGSPSRTLKTSKALG
jgi:hypothetical protein